MKTCANALLSRLKLRCAMPMVAPLRLKWIAPSEHMFSAKFVARCVRMRTGAEPRLFSFNNPMGACLKCDALASLFF